jgi:hypothetical protein
MNPLKKIGVLVGLAVMTFAATSCAAVSTEPDEATIVYSAARGSATKFSKCIGSSARESVSTSDNSWTYPAGQRTYDFTGAAGTESAPMKITSKDNVEMEVGGLVTFSLNTTDCATFQLFHEKVGLKSAAYLYGTESTGYDSDTPNLAGWRAMLNTYMRVPLDRALDAASQEFDWKSLFNDPKIKQLWEKRVGEIAGQAINETAGGSFFCAPVLAAGKCGSISVTLTKPNPPQILVDAMAAEQAAKAQNEAQKQLNVKADTEMESIAKLVKLLGPDAYVKLRAIQDGRAQIIISDGSGVTVSPEKKP